MKVPDSNKIISIAMLIGIVIALIVVYKIMTSIGLIKTGAKKREEKAESDAEAAIRENNYFDPYILEKYKSYVPLGDKKARELTIDLRSALSGPGTNEESVFEVFGKLKNKLNIAELSFYYKGAYKRNLKTDLLNELTDEEQLTLNQIISKLPNQ